MKTDSRTHLPGGTKTQTHRVVAYCADLRTETGMGTQALFGQRFDVIDSHKGVSRGALYSIVPNTERIDYIGFLPSSVLSVDMSEPTYVVTAVAAALFKSADIKSQVLGGLPRNSAVSGMMEDEFLKLPQGGFIHPRHVRDLKMLPSRSFIDFAMDMLSLPYIWGGTGQIGVDCSGLVQSALAATGKDAPRDTDQQELQLGEPVSFADRTTGDLLFWPGHVGIVVDGDKLLHANAHDMCVAMETVEQAVARIGLVRTTKRL